MGQFFVNEFLRSDMCGNGKSWDFGPYYTTFFEKTFDFPIVTPIPVLFTIGNYDAVIYF